MRTDHELLYCEGEGGGVQQDLSVVRQVRDDPVQHPLEILRQQLVGLWVRKQNHGFNMAGVYACVWAIIQGAHGFDV